jgi:hypothetical protein
MWLGFGKTFTTIWQWKSIWPSPPGMAGCSNNPLNDKRAPFHCVCLDILVPPTMCRVHTTGGPLGLGMHLRRRFSSIPALNVLVTQSEDALHLVSTLQTGNLVILSPERILSLPDSGKEVKEIGLLLPRALVVSFTVGTFWELLGVSP